MDITVEVTPSVILTNQDKDWYGPFAYRDEMTQLITNQISPAELLLQKQYDGDFPESDSATE